MSGKSLLYIAALLLLTLFGCDTGNTGNDQAKWDVNLDGKSKTAYGSYLAFQSLKYYFPEANIEKLSGSFRYTNMDSKMKYNYIGSTLLILEGLNFNVSQEEWKDLKQFISGGNEVILFCSSLDEKIEKELKCYKEIKGGEYNISAPSSPVYNDMNSLYLVNVPKKTYGYEGRSIRGFFSFSTDDTYSSRKTNTYTTTEASDNKDDNSKSTGNDWSVPDTLGYSYTNPDFLRYKLGEGHLTLHAAPLVLSNYFLLQEDNVNYLTGVWQTLPENIGRIYWNDYYKRDIEASSLAILWKYPSTRYALLLGLLALAFYVLFEGKRKQGIIPIIEPLRNDSVSFVETVGRLYYNKRNHTNLAEKMTQQFLEWVRTQYFLNTNLINENFIYQLTVKSGQPEATVRGLVEMIHEIKSGGVKLDDAYLYQLYNTIQQFYKNNRL